MTILQHHYTSSEGKGFQTSAVSSALDKDTILFLERVGVYIPPLSLPSRPTEEEIKNFPVSLSYYVLEDRKSAIIHSVYIGKDYSGRFGNYFSHSLVTDDYANDMKNLLPIQLWGSPTWVTKEGSSPELPPLSKVEAGSFMTWDAIFNFVATNDRLLRLSHLLTAAKESLKTKKRIIIVDSNQNIALWIAAVTFGLPRHLAQQISFTTYTKNPYSIEALICGTTSDSDFHFSAQEIEYEYFVFDFENNRFSKISEIDPYAEVVCKKFKDRNSKYFGDFSTFYDEIVSRAPRCQYDLYSLFALYSAISGVRISEEDWRKVITLIISYNLMNLFPNLLIEALQRLSDIPHAGRDLTLDAIDLYNEAAREGVDPIVRYKAAKALFSIAVLKYSPTATASDLEVILGKMKQFNLEQLQEECELKCLELLRDIQDVQKKLSLFNLFMTMRLLRSDSTRLASMLDHEIMPIITESLTQKLFRDALRTDFRVQFIHAFGRYLSGKIHDTKTLTAVSNMISDDLIYNDLNSFAIQQNNLRLYETLYGIYVQTKKDKIGLFLGFYKNIQKFSLKSNIEELEKAFSSTWGTSPPTFEETIKIVDGIASDDLYQCRFADLLAEVVYKNTNFIEPASKSIELAGQLLNSLKLSEEHRIILDVITTIPKLDEEREEDLKKLYTLATSNFFSANISLRKDILELFFRKLIMVNKHKNLHKDYVKILVELQNDDTIAHNAYRAAFRYAISDKSSSINIFVNSFKLWDKFYTRKIITRGAISDFLYTAFKDAFYSQKKKTREVIEEEICSDPQVKKRWELFKQETERGLAVTINRNIGKLTDLVKKMRQKKK